MGRPAGGHHRRARKQQVRQPPLPPGAARWLGWVGALVEDSSPSARRPAPSAQRPAPSAQRPALALLQPSPGARCSPRRANAAAPPRCRTNATFLPAAFVMGMQPRLEVDVEVVVIAEDGVTSARYPVKLSRKAAAQDEVAADAPAAESGGVNVTYDAPATAAQNLKRGEGR